jgi:hypothetical protein
VRKSGRDEMTREEKVPRSGFAAWVPQSETKKRPQDKKAE